MEERDFKDWQKKEKMHILFFDGASKGNSGLAGAGGVLVNPSGIPSFSFSWGIGT